MILGDLTWVEFVQLEQLLDIEVILIVVQNHYLTPTSYNNRSCCLILDYFNCSCRW